MQRRASLAAVSLLAVLGASACSPGGSTETPGSNAPESSTASDAPKVEKPKNLKAVTDACQLLTKQQVSDLGGTNERRPPQQSTNTYGEPSCQWANDAFTATVSINTKFGGLKRVMQNRKSRQDYKPTQLEGYEGGRVGEQSNLCRIELGIADDQSLEINYAKNAGGTPEMDDSCGFAEKITSEALKNVPDA
ncbi:DUF3558 domain-containing protein [Saccharopolyspora sp. WRP15-2]|uniref:DUF3558 domain-containing protein n=1 Tax=Saccharopolyspora oryzae TaxID=2997343 RepID=A0ABT4VA06_9PSEU|nr:DUF3558 domain-containing protein [Saccharopolyspora oryzae]MDA3630791.1 DUF3558 domain-containing protein [Saccharopolyspora oryzae]